eukprot:3524705-Amphidinium_carterae.1
MPIAALLEPGIAVLCLVGKCRILPNARKARSQSMFCGRRAPQVRCNSNRKLCNVPLWLPVLKSFAGRFQALGLS